MRSLILASSLLALTGTALAGTQDDVKACNDAVTKAAAESGEFQEPMVKFVDIDGASLKRITFEVKEGEKTETAVCSIKRGKIRDVEI